MLTQLTLHFSLPPNNTENPLKTYVDTLYLTQVGCVAVVSATT